MSSVDEEIRSDILESSEVSDSHECGSYLIFGESEKNPCREGKSSILDLMISSEICLDISSIQIEKRGVTTPCDHFESRIFTEEHHGDICFDNASFLEGNLF